MPPAGTGGEVPTLCVILWSLRHWPLWNQRDFSRGSPSRLFLSGTFSWYQLVLYGVGPADFKVKCDDEFYFVTRGAGASGGSHASLRPCGPRGPTDLGGKGLAAGPGARGHSQRGPLGRRAPDVTVIDGQQGLRAGGGPGAGGRPLEP